MEDTGKKVLGCWDNVGEYCENVGTLWGYQRDVNRRLEDVVANTVEMVLGIFEDQSGTLVECCWGQGIVLQKCCGSVITDVGRYYGKGGGILVFTQE